jgi:hypothetical protein
LAPWPISFLALGSAGVAPQWTEESCGRRARGGFGSRQPTPPADRPPHGKEADPTALARSRLLRERFPREYASTRARRVVNLRTMLTDNDDLWSFIMLPDTPPVSRLPLSFWFLVMYWCDLDGCH